MSPESPSSAPLPDPKQTKLILPKKKAMKWSTRVARMKTLWPLMTLSGTKILWVTSTKGSHHELPSLKIVRSASVKALDWLKSYYWEPRSKAIPFQGEGIEKVKKEIKSKIRELAIYLKVNGSAQSSSSLLKGKRL
ncbi:LAS protein [Spatholobus suberectus]|nr:LAS protein [Spatholobus suberectus]